MTADKKTKLVKEIRGEILKDWGRCKRKHLVWGCYACFAGLVIDFLDDWIHDIKEDENVIHRWF